MKKWISISIISIVVIAGILAKVYLNAVAPVDRAEEKAVSILKKDTKLTGYSDFELYSGEETYYVLKAKDKKKPVYVWISEKSGKVVTRAVNTGTSKQEAVDTVYSERNPKEIISVRLGMARIQKTDRPAWEVYYRTGSNSINYFYVDFDTGKKIRSIDNF
ncbi:DUF5590 domain-containing protein [Mesobacillus zeae]|uniref:Peptidase n=1 Tax=Mesobacillus zeae TaxID=1917180 RepID=A0A398AYE8_9BACI|nr:DUF5590 domain-containing protein [Mesobacillus zeae]RID82551.1 peptidase [Mesobacillus zeae]